MPVARLRFERAHPREYVCSRASTRARGFVRPGKSRWQYAHGAPRPARHELRLACANPFDLDLQFHFHLETVLYPVIDAKLAVIKCGLGVSTADLFLQHRVLHAFELIELQLQ